MSQGELLRLRTTVASLDAAVGFVATLAGAGPVLDSLLASSTLTDVQVGCAGFRAGADVTLLLISTPVKGLAAAKPHWLAAWQRSLSASW